MYLNKYFILIYLKMIIVMLQNQITKKNHLIIWKTYYTYITYL